MKILFLIRGLGAGGTERATTALASQFSRAGHTASILCCVGRESFYPVDPEVTVRYLNDMDADATSGVFGLLRRAKALRAAVRDEAPDVLVCMSWVMSLYGLYCVRGTRVVCVGTERSNPFILNAGRVQTFLRRYAASHCDGFVCQTERARSFFPAASQDRIAVIPNGVFNPRVYDISVPNEREPVITALGRLDHNKGFDVLLDAFAVVHEKHPELTLRIFGDGAERDALLTQAKLLGIDACTDLPGLDAGAIERIARSAVFVLPSRSEGMPNALIEAMAAGVPCVASRCDMGPQELIEDGVSGLLVPVEDAQATAQAIERVLSDPSLAAKLSENATHIRVSHDPAQIAQRWLQYFAQCLARRS